MTRNIYISLYVSRRKIEYDQENKQIVLKYVIHVT